jgi:acyl-coenzyme A synthetase/AMP-(fatty) acid ligase
LSASFRLLARHGERGAVTRDRGVEDLLRDAGAIAAQLEPARRVGEQVLVVCHDRYRFACALIAAISRGLVVALPPSTQPEMMRALRQHEDVRTVLHDQDDVPGLDVRACVGDASREPLALRVIEAEETIVVVYTSGTTGTPLRCPKTARQLLGEAEALAATFSLGVGDHLFATVPPHHIYGLLFGLLVPLVSGCSFVRETSLHAAPLAAMYAREAANVLVSVPAHLRGLEVLPPDAFASSPPRRVFSSGAALPEAVSVMLAERFGLSVTEVLGSSETGGIGHRTAVSIAGSEAAPFVVLPGVRVSEGEGGRMQIVSPFVDATAPVPYVSADRVVVIDERRFMHLGRADGVVKVGGTRVSLQEIEARLLAIPGVTDAHVWAVAVGGARGHETRAVVAGKAASGELLSVEEIRRELLRWLEPVVLPRRVRVLEALPRESTGKLRRDVLEALFG